MMGTAFRIDDVILDPGGIHWPLIAEIGGIIDGLWQPGETWEFVIQDYVNALGKPASLLGSIGVASMSAPFTADASSGSIIAIPEPATMAILGVGCALIKRRKKA